MMQPLVWFGIIIAVALSAGAAPDDLSLVLCGVLMDYGDGCIFFASDHEAFVLDSYGTFSVGDTVLAAGVLEHMSSPQCGLDYRLADNVIQVCDTFDYGCGVITRGGFDDQCIYFESPVYRRLDVRGLLDEYEVGDSIRVVGLPTHDCISFCGYDGCVEAHEISPCDTLTAVHSLSWGRLKLGYR